MRLLDNSQSWWPRRKETGGYSGGRSRQESEGDDNEDPVPLASSVVRTPTVSPEVPSPDPQLGPQGIQVWLFSSQLPNLPTAQDRPTAHWVLQMKFPHPTPVLSGTKSYCAASAQPIRQQINQHHLNPPLGSPRSPTIALYRLGWPPGSSHLHVTFPLLGSFQRLALVPRSQSTEQSAKVTRTPRRACSAPLTHWGTPCSTPQATGCLSPVSRTLHRQHG